MLAQSKKLAVLGMLVLCLAGCSRAAVTVQPTAAATTASTQSSVSPTLASAQLLVDDWDNREIFRSGLIKDEQKTLTQLAGASIYHLDVQIDDNLTALHGQERVRYTNQEDKALNEVYFQLFPNMEGGKSNVTAASVDGQTVQPVYEANNDTARVPLSTALQPGQHIVIQMDFQVEVPTDVTGGNYGLLGYLNNILVLDGFYPAIPVYDAKGWHAGQLPPNSDTTFQDASFYVVRVTAPAALKLIASGLQVDSTQKDDHQVVTFAVGPARDFYMAASERFEVVSDMVGETKVNSYAFADSAQGSNLALQTAVNAIKSYSQRLGTYPYTEFDVVSTPMQGALGIEYPGITGINYAIYDIGSSTSSSAAINLEGTVAHEVGHQWFYNVVGNDQINEPWLDESVTQYITGLYFLDQYGAQGWSGSRDSWLSRWERVANKLMPIGLPAVSYQDKEYGAIIYGRGPLFVDALEQKLGQKVFDQFLRDYYQAHKWGIATTAEFKQFAEKDCQCDLTALFDEWVTPK